MIEIQWKLADYLQTHGLTAYKLVKAIGSETKAGTVYRLARKGEEPSRVDLPTLQNVIAGLRKLTGEPVTLSDVFEVIEKSEPESTAIAEAKPFKWKDLKRYTAPEAEDFTSVLRELREHDRQIETKRTADP